MILISAKLCLTCDICRREEVIPLSGTDAPVEWGALDDTVAEVMGRTGWQIKPLRETASVKRFPRCVCKGCYEKEEKE